MLHEHDTTQALDMLPLEYQAWFHPEGSRGHSDSTLSGPCPASQIQSLISTWWVAVTSQDAVMCCRWRAGSCQSCRP